MQRTRLTLEDFTKQVKVLEEDWCNIDNAVEKATKQNPFIQDGYGVPAEWLFKVFEHSVFNLVKAVVPKADDNAITEFIGYAIWECGLKKDAIFGGLIEVDREYDFTKLEDVYAYICDEISEAN